MSIGLTPEEEIIISDISEFQEDLIDLNDALSSLNLSLQATLDYEVIHKKFYDWWNLLSRDLEVELEYTSGDWVDTPVTEPEIILTANGEENRLYPIESEGYTDTAPKRIAQLDGPTDIDFQEAVNPSPPPAEMGPFEYSQIDVEIANQGIVPPAQSNRTLAQIAQRDALVDYTIPSLNEFISESSSEVARYPALQVLIDLANTSLIFATEANVRVQAEIDAGSPSSPIDPNRITVYLPSRKSVILSRAASHAASFSDSYDQRYGWLNIRCNQISGTLSDTISTQSSIVFIQGEIDSLEEKIAIYEDVT